MPKKKQESQLYRFSGLKVTVAWIILMLVLVCSISGAESFAPDEFFHMEGNDRFFIASGKSSSVIYGPKLKWCRLATPFLGYPANPIGLVEAGDNLIAAATKQRISLLGEDKAWFADNFEGLEHSEILGIEKLKDSVFFYTEDGWGFADNETGKISYRGGFQAKTGEFLKQAVQTNQCIWVLAWSGRVYLYCAEDFSLVSALSDVDQIIGDDENLIALTDEKKLLRYHRLDGVSTISDVFKLKKRILMSGSPILLSDKEYVSSDGVVRKLKFPNCSAISGFEGILSAEKAGTIHKLDGEILPMVKTPYRAPVGFISSYDENMLLYNDGTIQGSESITKLEGINNPQRIYPIQGNAILSTEQNVGTYRINKVLGQHSQFSTAPLPEKPDSAFLQSESDTDALFALCQCVESGKYYSSYSGETTEITKKEFASLLAEKRLSLSGDELDAVVSLIVKYISDYSLLRDVISIPSCTDFDSGAIVLLLPHRVIIYDLFTTLTTVHWVHSREEEWQGIVHLSDFLYVYSKHSVYLLESRKLRESYTPGGEIEILGMVQDYGEITILLSCGTARTVPGFCVSTTNGVDRFKIDLNFFQRFYEWEPGLEFKGIDTILPISEKWLNQVGVPHCVEALKSEPFGDFNHVEMFSLTGNNVELQFVRHFPRLQESDNWETAVLHSLHTSEPLPFPTKLPELSLAKTYSSFASTGGTYLLSTNLTERLSYRELSIKLLPFHQSSRETFLGVRISKPVSPFSNGWLAVSEPYSVTVDALSLRVIELSFKAPEIVSTLAPDKDLSELSICYVDEIEQIVPLPTLFSKDEGRFFCTVPPSIWKDSNSVTFLVGMDVDCLGGGFEVLDGNLAFLFTSDSVGELSLPLKGNVKFSCYRGEEFLFGASSGSISDGISWKKKGYDATEMFGSPIFSNGNVPLKIVGTVKSKGYYRKFVCSLNVPINKVTSPEIFPLSTSLIQGSKISFFCKAKLEDEEYFVLPNLSFSIEDFSGNTFTIPSGMKSLSVSASIGESKEVFCRRNYSVSQLRGEILTCKSQYKGFGLFLTNSSRAVFPRVGEYCKASFPLSRLFAMFSKQTDRDFYPYFYGAYRR